MTGAGPHAPLPFFFDPAGGYFRYQMVHQSDEP
jgi:hypothetical protein